MFTAHCYSFCSFSHKENGFLMKMFQTPAVLQLVLLPFPSLPALLIYNSSKLKEKIKQKQFIQHFFKVFFDAFFSLCSFLGYYVEIFQSLAALSCSILRNVPITHLYGYCCIATRFFIHAFIQGRFKACHSENIFECK